MLIRESDNAIINKNIYRRTIMTILKAIILGIVQGATEFLPVSSSGHLSVMQHFMGLSGNGALFVTVMLHVGTLAAVILVFYKTFWMLIKEFFKALFDLVRGKFSFRNMSNERSMLVMLIISCLPLLILMVPFGGDMRFKDIVSSFAEDNDIVLEGCCFLLTAFVLFSACYVQKHNKHPRPAVNSEDALYIGFAQLFAACLPGLSRSGSTISAGMLSGVDKNYMVTYSFVLGTPAVLAASLVEIKDAFGTAQMAPEYKAPVIAGMITAAIVGVLAIKLLQWMVRKDKFRFFAWYCTVLGVIVTGIGISEYIK
jgi:undecaprenyl-diphosphatase